jgi:hypothetical protein
MKRVINGNFARSLVLIGVIAAPIIASAEDEGKNDTKNELGFMGGGGRGQSVGCVSANLLNFSGAVEYSRKIKEDQKVVVHGYYQGSKSESETHPDLANQAAITAYYSYNVNRYFGFSAGLTSDYLIDKHPDGFRFDNISFFPVMPSLELRAGRLDLVYFAIRFQHPDMTLNYDWAGVDIVVPAWKYAEFTAGVNIDVPTTPISAQLGIRIKPAKWISIPLSMKYNLDSPIKHGFNVTAGLMFDF